MRYERLHQVEIPKIGFGTWKIGGEASPRPDQDDRSLRALRSALELGYTHFDTAENYAAGHTEDLLGQAIREAGARREELFLTSKVWPNHLRYEQVLAACEGSLKRLQTGWLDLYLIHWPNEMTPLRETFRALNQLVREGRVRHLGVSNFDLRLLKQACSLSESPLLTDQVPFNLHDRAYLKNGVLAYCQENDILLTAYSPVEKGRLQNHPALQSVAEAHQATIYQIALAWLANKPRLLAIPKSLDPQHQAENLAAGEIRLSPAEMDLLNAL